MSTKAVTPQQLAAGKPCPSCKTTGVLPTGDRRQPFQVCPNCQGNGYIQLQPIRVPFWIVLANVALTANQQNVSQSVQLDADADFEMVWIMSSSTGLYSVTPFDPSTGRQLCTSGNPINGENFAGTAQNPFPLVEPYVWSRASIVKMNFNDRSGAPNTIQMVLGGFKLFPRDNQTQGSQGAIVQA